MRPIHSVQRQHSTYRNIYWFGDEHLDSARTYCFTLDSQLYISTANHSESRQPPYSSLFELSFGKQFLCALLSLLPPLRWGGTASRRSPSRGFEYSLPSPFGLSPPLVARLRRLLTHPKIFFKKRSRELRRGTCSWSWRKRRA
jgi:hypothetical protein